MDDVRTRVVDLVDRMTGDGAEPVFLVADLFGAEVIYRTQGPVSFERFMGSVIDAVSSCTNSVDAFACSETRIVAVLAGVTRIRTFSFIDKLQHVLPLLSQSFDCDLDPQFDLIAYDPKAGAAGI